VVAISGRTKSAAARAGHDRREDNARAARRSYEVRRGTEGNWFVRVSSTRWGAAKRAEAGIPYVHENLYTAADAAINER
jgi:hypothetical protein